ncbi:MAG: hypothetical protein ISR82_01560 [Candidatus Marinimicrobia bacterium]|nr:hypothetical protein [Candidatus Neomarinimicrobiota bacterium]MBL7009893.1 hypothetical protein [Candidatus Neomarinimicrobiota bacterium]MBL7030156.1 hypothetical protein [Candidatus Neomarinimicrobiota bacterium]
MKKFFLFLFGIFMVSSCDYNPFFGKDKISNRKISGHVQLDKVEFYPSGYHEGVLVWIEGLGIKTFTDIDGSFELTLPAANDISSGGIADGEYTIHFFMGNYQISILKVKFAAGQVVADPQVIDIDGTLKRTIILKRIMGLKTTVSPEIITSGFDDDIIVAIDLTADRIDLYVKLRKLQDRSETIYTGLLIQNSSTKKLAYTVNIDSASLDREFIARPSKNFEININYADLNLPKDTYEVIPYIFIEREDIPAALLSAIGFGYNDFSQNFFQFPFKRSGGKLVIQ